MKIILIPNYYLTLSDIAQLKLRIFYDDCIHISFSYYLKAKNNFYKQLSFISYNPYMFPKYSSQSKKYINCRRTFFLKYVILYKVYDHYVEILDIFHSRSNYLQ